MTNLAHSRKKPRFLISGPGALVAAAFIGPGTLTTCSLAGARFGYALLWGLLFSIIATIILQEMTARLGILTNQGLGEALRKHFSRGLPRLMTWVLVVSAIVMGNAAFQTGNIMGAALGLESATGSDSDYFRIWVIITASLAFTFLFIGSYKMIERILTGLVILMSFTFIITAVIIAPDLPAILKGLTIPSIPKGSVITLVGLIGTTVVPYNLFLHAAAVRERWTQPEMLPEARKDLAVSVILGGIISMSIVITSSVAFAGSGSSISGVADLGVQLEPLLGRWARYFMGTGLFAAGISSAITAPLAAAYATQGTLGWERNLRSKRFRMVWIFIVLTGTLFALLGFRPLEAIVFAQAANGILLPVIAIYLLFIMNSKKVMGEHVNGWLSNIAGTLVVVITIGLGIRSILSAFGMI